MSSVAPAKSTRVGAFDSMRIGFLEIQIWPLARSEIVKRPRPRTGCVAESLVLIRAELGLDSVQNIAGNVLHTRHPRLQRSIHRFPQGAEYAPPDFRNARRSPATW